MTKFHPRSQGDLGEAAAIQWLTSIGAIVAFPLFHSPDYDLVAELGGRLVRVQVKTSRHLINSTGHFAVQLSTAGGNQSWTGTVKVFDPSRVDFLFVLVRNGRCWFIPSEEIEGRRSIHVGGPKYPEYEVRVHAVPPWRRRRTASRIARGAGGVPKRSTGLDCKSNGSAFAGSNPASPI
jgi:hypothetical protein